MEEAKEIEVKMKGRKNNDEEDQEYQDVEKNGVRESSGPVVVGQSVGVNPQCR